MARTAPAASPGGGSSSRASESAGTEATALKLSRARDLEAALESASAEAKKSRSKGGSGSGGGGGGGGDERAQALRLRLCEVLSDVLLNDPLASEASDAVGRLWKHCFYGRIAEMRSRASKERARAKKRGGGGGDPRQAEAARRAAGELDRRLQQFLKEAIQLYRYIVERYAKELAPPSQSQSQFSAADEGGGEEESRRSRAVVSSLHRMHVHLGDLHRYGSDAKSAGACYSVGAKLAPGTGNPHNQLAVVAQGGSEPATLVALYHYARSLMATRRPFETSRGNLARLFEANRRWTEEHGREEEGGRHRIVDVGEGGGGTRAPKDKKARKEWAAKERAAANRRALARVVDLQWDLFRGVSLDDDGGGGVGDDGPPQVDLDALLAKMDAVLASLEGLISQASFGEKLLCQLVAVLAFSSLGAGSGGRLVDASEATGAIMTNQALAFSFLLRFSAVLARDATAVLEKKKAAVGASGRDGGAEAKLGTIRSLSPLLLGLRFAASVHDGSCERFHGRALFPGGGVGGTTSGHAVGELCARSHREFWGAVAAAADGAGALPPRRGGGEEGAAAVEAKDLAEFRGYVPFAPFLEGERSGEDGDYVSAEEALVVLSPSTGGDGGGGRGSEAETAARVDLLVSVADAVTGPPNAEAGGDYVLRLVLGGTGREYLDVGGADDEAGGEGGFEVEEGAAEGKASSRSPSPDDARDDMEAEDAVPAAKGAMDEVLEEFPGTAPYPQPGMALLTPAALLAGSAGVGPHAGEVATKASRESNEPPSVLDALLAPSDIAPPFVRPSSASTPVAPAYLAPAFVAARAPLPAPPGLPPPPGFFAHPPPAPLPAPLAAPSATGIDLLAFAPPPHRPTSAPQAGPRYSAATAGGFETANPFARVPPMTTFQGDLFPPAAQAPPGFPGAPQGVVGHQQRLDPTLDFLLGGDGLMPPAPPPRGAASSSALDLMVPPPAAEPDDQTASIMNFLFEPSDEPSRRPLYGGHLPSSQVQRGVPPTKNPFAT